jgi:hypothetical protein
MSIDPDVFILIAGESVDEFVFKIIADEDSLLIKKVKLFILIFKGFVRSVVSIRIEPSSCFIRRDSFELFRVGNVPSREEYESKEASLFSSNPNSLTPSVYFVKPLIRFSSPKQYVLSYIS